MALYQRGSQGREVAKIQAQLRETWVACWPDRRRLRRHRKRSLERKNGRRRNGPMTARARISRAAYDAALRTAKRWLKREDVIAVGLGLRRKGKEGKHTAEPCVVVTVRWKRKPKRLMDLGVRPLPKQIRVRIGARVHLVPIDIQGAGGRKRGRVHGLVACPLTTAEDRWGMVGAVVARGKGRLILTAAHVARAVGTKITVQTPKGSVTGTTREVHKDDNLDHALIEPDSALPANAGRLPGGERIQAVRALSTLELGEIVYFQVRDGSLKQVTLAKVNEAVKFDMPGGEVVFSGVISTTPQESRSGDSGTLLYDKDFCAVGTLLGELPPYSCFLPCQPSFELLDVTLDS